MEDTTSKLLDRTYLRYELNKTFGIITSNRCNVLHVINPKLKRKEIITAAYDEVLVWDASKLEISRKYSAIIGNDSTFNPVHRDEVTCICVNDQVTEMIVGRLSGRVDIYDFNPSSVTGNFSSKLLSLKQVVITPRASMSG